MWQVICAVGHGRLVEGILLVGGCQTAIAQFAEQQAENLCVGSSILPSCTKMGL